MAADCHQLKQQKATMRTEGSAPTSNSRERKEEGHALGRWRRQEPKANALTETLREIKVDRLGLGWGLWSALIGPTATSEIHRGSSPPRTLDGARGDWSTSASDSEQPTSSGLGFNGGSNDAQISSGMSLVFLLRSSSLLGSGGTDTTSVASISPPRNE